MIDMVLRSIIITLRGCYRSGPFAPIELELAVSFVERSNGPALSERSESNGR